MKVKCFKCDGKGETRGKIDWFSGVFTLGMTALMDASSWEECGACDGRGYINEN